MPEFGRLPRSWSGPVDLHRRIHGFLRLLFALLVLLWPELSVRRSGAVSFNNLVVADLLHPLECLEIEGIPAGRGGKGDFHGAARRASVCLLAGLGGKEEISCSNLSPALKWRCLLHRLSDVHQAFFILPAGRGGEGEDELCLLSFGSRRCWLPWWCYEAADVCSLMLWKWWPLRRALHTGTFAGVLRLAPVFSGRMAALVEPSLPWKLLFNLLFWRPFISSLSTLLVACAPSGVVPGGAVDGRRWSFRLGGDLGPDCISCYQFRVLCAYFQDVFVIFMLYEVLCVFWSVTA